MSEYLITCVRKGAPTGAGHRHIIGVGIGAQRVTVQDVYLLMDAGHKFRTVSPTTGLEVPVAKYRCCGIDTLRSYADKRWDDNLDALPPCP
ncbi:DUF3892 domain-containing protein [Trebonia sp.]|uniref:DUF3892 domain-containing protein n=1 Tax=Trebonia sp. TaxID=2767075 RepID=UPI00261EC0A3|nr:DUF3892 domain-containing protein [Trebonia sp.]